MNSLQAMAHGGAFTVGIFPLDREKTSGRRFRITFEDTGEGIAPEDLEKVFDPFYTNKNNGTGLGLPISYSIVKSHGGEIDIDSVKGKGTKVVVEL